MQVPTGVSDTDKSVRPARPAPTDGRALGPRRLPSAAHTRPALSIALLAALLLPACSSSPDAAPTSPVSTGVRSADPAAASYTTESWFFGDTPGRLLTTTSYRILTTDDAPLVSDRLPAFMESALAAYRSLFAPLPAPPRQLDVYLMGTRPQWELLTRQTAGPRADIYLRIQRGGYAESARAVLYNIGPRDTFAIAGHEGWHQYTQATFREALPIWLEEGIAVSMEGFRWDETSSPSFLAWSNLERYDRLRELTAAGRLSPLDELLNQRPQDLLQGSGLATLDYYAQIWALTLFLREGAGGSHRAALESMVRDACAGRLADRLADVSSSREARAAMLSRVGHTAFEAYFGPVANSSSEFEAFVRHAVRPGGRERVLHGESPVN
jgi:hypothetical protein